MSTEGELVVHGTKANPATTRVSVEFLTGGAPILVLAPHPDDESLGCGGLLAAAWEGAGALVVSVSDGGGSHPGSRQWSSVDLAELRRSELHAAIQALGGRPADVAHLRCTDGAVPRKGDEFERLARRIATHGLGRGCRRVFATASVDAHADHKATAALAVRVMDLMPEAVLYSYPVWARWDTPGRSFVSERETLFTLDTRPWRQHKRQAIEQHRSQRGLIVADDAEGFVLPEAMVELFVSSDEWYIGAST